MIVIVGDPGGNLMKRRASGAIDSGFGLHGTAENSGVGYYNAAIQSDGKIVAAGGGLVRYNTNGHLDNSFSGDGKQTLDLVAYAVAIQKDGKIVVAGTAGIINGNQFEMALARYNTNGSPDSTFDGDGLVKSNRTYKDPFGFTTSIALQNDGKIVVTGGFSIVRYNADGTEDKTFNGNGIQAFEAFNSIKIQSDGKIVAIGLTSYNDGVFIKYAVCRLNADASFDKSFSGDGQQPDSNEIQSLALQSDRKIITVSTLVLKLPAIILMAV